MIKTATNEGYCCDAVLRILEAEHGETRGEVVRDTPLQRGIETRVSSEASTTRSNTRSSSRFPITNATTSHSAEFSTRRLRQVLPIC
jgi:hypothetical protein